MFIIYLQKLFGMAQSQVYSFKYEDKDFKTDITTADGAFIEAIFKTMFEHQSVSKENEALVKRIQGFIDGTEISPKTQESMDTIMEMVKSDTAKLKEAEVDNKQS